MRQADLLSAFVCRLSAECNSAGRTDWKVCVLFCGNEYFIRLSASLYLPPSPAQNLDQFKFSAAGDGGSYNAFGKALPFHFRDGHFPSAE